MLRILVLDQTTQSRFDAKIPFVITFIIGALAVPQGEAQMADRYLEEEKIPVMQQLLDNPFILLFLGVMIPMVVYTLWGVIDILTVPLAK